MNQVNTGAHWANYLHIMSTGGLGKAPCITFSASFSPEPAGGRLLSFMTAPKMATVRLSNSWRHCGGSLVRNQY